MADMYTSGVRIMILWKIYHKDKHTFCDEKYITQHSMADMYTSGVRNMILWKIYHEDKHTFCDEKYITQHSFLICTHQVEKTRYGVAAISRLLKIIRLFCKRAL